MEAETGAYHKLVEGVGDELVLLAQLKARVGAEEAVEELSGIREPDDGGHDVLHCAQVAHHVRCESRVNKHVIENAHGERREGLRLPDGQTDQRQTPHHELLARRVVGKFTADAR